MIELTEGMINTIKENSVSLEGIYGCLKGIKDLYSTAKENKSKIEYFDIIKICKDNMTPMSSKETSMFPIISVYTDTLINIAITYDSFNQANIKFERSPIWTPDQMKNNINQIFEMEKAKEYNIIFDQFQDLFDRLISVIFVLSNIVDEKDRKSIIDEYFGKPAEDPIGLLESVNNMIFDLIE